MNSQNNRIVELDILRGLALFGVTLVNIFYFQVPTAFFDSYYAGFTDLPNRGAIYLMNWFFNEKFYPIFSFLFGLGIAIQFLNFKANGKNPYQPLLRRLFLLLFFGVLHVLFVWEGDILLIYALFGFVLLSLLRLTPKLLLTSAVFFYFVPVAFDVLNNLLTILGSDTLYVRSFEAYIQFYTQASYGQILVERLVLFSQMFLNVETFISEFTRLAYFLLGAFVVRQGLLAPAPKDHSFWRRVFFVSLSFFAIGFFIDKLWLNDLRRFNNPILFSLEDLNNSLVNLFLVLIYLSGFLLLLRLPRVAQRLDLFSRLGRMTLTIYFLHTIFYSFLFYSYGLRLYASLSPLELYAVSLGYFLAAAFLSRWWLHRFYFGPLEWLWRSITYGRWLPLKKQS